MDPNATLKMLRDLATDILMGGSDHEDAAEQIAEAFESLDQWISRNGFLPDDWVASDSGRMKR